MRSLWFASLLIALSLPGQATDWGRAVKEAGKLHRKGDLKGAESGLFKALLLAEAFGPTDPRLGFTLDYLGTLSLQAGEPEKADPMFRRALKVFEGSRGAASDEALETASNLAESLEARGLNQEAEPLYRRVVEAKRKDPMQRSTDLNNYGLCLDALGRQDEALAHYELALELRRKARGEKSLEAAEIYSNQARVYYMKGDFARAEALFVKALAIDEKKLGENHPQVADDCLRLAPLYRKTGDLAKAEALEARAAAIKGKP